MENDLIPLSRDPFGFSGLGGIPLTGACPAEAGFSSAHSGKVPPARTRRCDRTLVTEPGQVDDRRDHDEQQNQFEMFEKDREHPDFPRGWLLRVACATRRGAAEVIWNFSRRERRADIRRAMLISSM